MKKKADLSFKDKLSSYAVFGFMILFFIWAIFGDEIYELYHTPVSYAESVKAGEGLVINKTTEGFSPVHYYLRLVPVTADVHFSYEDSSWVEVKPPFYESVKLQSRIGVLYVFSKVYDKNIFTASRTFRFRDWTISEVYPAWKDADAANPVTRERIDGTVLKMKSSDAGENYLMLSLKNRTVRVQVSADRYRTAFVGQTISCSTESVGDFLKVVSIR